MSVIRLYGLMVEQSRVLITTGSRNINLARVVLAGLVALISGISVPLLADMPITGKALVMEKSKGNCLACHAIANGKQPGNIGPPLMVMKARFPDAEILHKQIWDATENNPDTRMPPFGRHGILSREEIDLIVEYLYTL